MNNNEPRAQLRGPTGRPDTYGHVRYGGRVAPPIPPSATPLNTTITDGAYFAQVMLVSRAAGLLTAMPHIKVGRSGDGVEGALLYIPLFQSVTILFLFFGGVAVIMI